MHGLGERIRELRIRRGISQAALADALEVSRSAIAMWEGNSREPALDMLVRIADTLHAPLAELLSAGSVPAFTPVQTRKIPLLSTAEPAPSLESAPGIDASESDCDFALRIADDSMAPTLQPGDTVFLRKAEPAADGQIVAILHEGRVCLKRLYRTSGLCTLLSDNPRCAPFALHSPQILGVAVAYRRPLTP